MSEAEWRDIVEEWNRTDAPFLKTHCVHHLFEDQVRKNPNAVAIRYDDQEVNYHELNRLSNQLANHLTDLGVGPNVRVGLCVNSSLDMLVGLLGVLKAGGAYVPLDPAHGKNVLAYQIVNADVRLILTQSALRRKLPNNEQLNLYLDISADWLGDKSANKNPITPTEPNDLAYAIYPQTENKYNGAVAMPHSALSNLIQWQIRQSNCGIGSKTLLFNPSTSDLCFQEVFSTLCSGGVLILKPEKRCANYAYLWQVIRDKEIERIFMKDYVLKKLADDVQKICDLNGGDPLSKALKEMTVNGMPFLVTSQIRNLFRRLSQCRLVAQCAWLETQVATTYEFFGSVDSWRSMTSIGKPIANNKLYILDSLLRPMLTGSVGDIYIGGMGLAQGYLKKVSSTETKFVPSPFARSSDEYIFKTGMRARLSPNGNVELAK